MTKELKAALDTIVANAATAAERERCAKIAENFPSAVLQFIERPGGPPGNYMRAATGADIAAAIRSGQEAPVWAGEGLGD